MKVTRSGVFWTVAAVLGPLAIMLGRFCGRAIFGKSDIHGVADWFAEGVGAFVFTFAYMLAAAVLFTRINRPPMTQ